MQQSLMSAAGSSLLARSYRPRGALKRGHAVIVADRRTPLVVNAALATRAPPRLLQPVPWTEIFQALVLPAPVAAPKPQPQRAMEEECPWLDDEAESSHRRSMYFSHLADRMAMEPQDE